MLSTNSSVSAPVVSRKYSAIVRADRATRRRAPGGSFIWPNTMHVWSMTLRPVSPIFGFLHFQPQVGAFAGPLADAGEHRVTAVRPGDAGDQLGEDDRLAEAGPAEQAGLAAADERREQVDDLDAGFEQLGLGRQVGEAAAASRWIGQRSSASTGPRPSTGSPSRLNTRPSVALPTGTVTGRAGVDARPAADQAVGAAQGDAADAAAAQVLLHLAGQVDLHALVLGRRSCTAL